MEPVRIRTNRLLLTPLRDSDAETFLRYRSQPEVARYQSWAPGSLAEAIEFVNSFESIAFDTPGTWYQLAVRLGESDELVGDLGVHFLQGEPLHSEIGFTIAPSYQQQGLGTEAARALLRHLFGPLGKHRVFASVDPRNTPSMALLERIGMQQEAHVRDHWPEGKWADDVLFAIIKSDWARANS